MNRRTFIKKSGGIIAASFINAHSSPASVVESPAKSYTHYKGFNIIDQAFINAKSKFREEDFEYISEWGMNFARIPLVYWNWSSKDDWLKINEDAMKNIDEVVELGKQYKVHINLCFHRVPGYCINERNLEKMDLFNDSPDRMQLALNALNFHWKYFAKRYKGIPSDRLSFNLLNEPPYHAEKRYEEVVRTVVNGIREEDTDRLIVVDGNTVAREPLLKIFDLNVVQSTRGYLPMELTHYGASWIHKDKWNSLNIPTWPLKADKGTNWDKNELKRRLIDMWQPLIDKNIPIHVGEWGCHNKTPHDVMLAWARDILSIWKEVNWGQALWNLRGPFGVLDSNRKDVTYENFKGHKLDRKFLELLKEFK
jgi:endoglucanase